MTTGQMFAIKSSHAARAAERFFKERRITVQYVDLQKKPMAAGEIRRFIERYTLQGLLDTESKAYVDGGLKYMKMSDSEWLEKIGKNPQLLRLPFLRAGNKICIGKDEEGWKAMLAA